MPVSSRSSRVPRILPLLWSTALAMRMHPTTWVARMNMHAKMGTAVTRQESESAAELLAKAKKQRRESVERKAGLHLQAQAQLAQQAELAQQERAAHPREAERDVHRVGAVGPLRVELTPIDRVLAAFPAAQHSVNGCFEGDEDARLGCRGSCKCQWFEQCFRKDLLWRDGIGKTEHIDVGTCQVSMTVMHLTAAAIFMGFLLVVTLVVGLWSDEQKHTEQRRSLMPLKIPSAKLKLTIRNATAISKDTASQEQVVPADKAPGLGPDESSTASSSSKADPRWD